MGGGNISAAEPMMNDNGTGSGETQEVVNAVPSQNTVLVGDDQSLPLPPLISSYKNSMIPRLFDAVHTLRCMNVIKEGTILPKIVVIGDESSGKCSVIESLTGVSLPHSQGICTRIPLIMKFQHHPDLVSKLHLEYQGKCVSFDKTELAIAARIMETELKQASNNLFDASITFTVEQLGVSEMTIVDIPGINTSSGVDEQNKDLEATKGLIMKLTQNEYCVYLNVISASDDLWSSTSTQLLKELDPMGQRTLTAITKYDWYDEKLKFKISMSKLPFRTTFVPVAVFGESFQESRVKETNLFNQPLFSALDKSSVGIDSLARRVVLVMLSIMIKSSLSIVHNIDKNLESIEKLTVTTEKFETINQATPTFMSVVKASEKTLYKLFISQDYGDYKDDIQMHSAARIIDKLENLFLVLKEPKQCEKKPFLFDEIKLINENRWNICGLAPTCVFNPLLEKRIEGSCLVTKRFVSDVWDYIEHVVLTVLLDHSKNHPQLNLAIKRTARKMIERQKNDFSRKILEMMEMQEIYNWTCDPSFISSWEKMKLHNCELTTLREDGFEHKVVNVPGIGSINLGHLKNVHESHWHVAFNVRIMLIAYWDVVVKRTVDYITLNIMFSLKQMINGEMESIMMSELKNEKNKVEVLLKEEPSLSVTRVNLKTRTELLRKVKKDIKKLQDDFASAFLFD